MDGLDIVRGVVQEELAKAPKPITASTINLMIQASLADFVAHQLPLAVQAVIDGPKPAGTGAATSTAAASLPGATNSAPVQTK